MRQRVSVDSEAAALEPAWSLPADRHAVVGTLLRRRARSSALQLIKDIDEADAVLKQGKRDARGTFPTPRPGRWREVEKRVQADTDE